MPKSLFDITQQQTQRLATPLPGYCSFHVYLLQHHLYWRDVARAAQLPALVVWSIDHGLAVSQANAEAVRAALARLTGTPFTGFLATIE